MGKSSIVGQIIVKNHRIWLLWFPFSPAGHVGQPAAQGGMIFFVISWEVTVE